VNFVLITCVIILGGLIGLYMVTPPADTDFELDYGVVCHARDGKLTCK
jgi:hypothetical protein